jgi:hypothetical protein
MAYSRLFAITLLATPFVARPERAQQPQAPAYSQVAAADDKFVETGAKGRASRPHAPSVPAAPHRTNVVTPRPASAHQEDTHSDNYVCEHGDPQSDLTIDACFRRDHAHD